MLIIVACFFKWNEKCDDIYKYNKTQRQFQNIEFENIKKDKTKLTTISLYNDKNPFESSYFALTANEIQVPIYCKILYPLTIRGIINEEEISSILVVKSLLSIYLIAKATSSILHSLGLVLLATVIIDSLYCKIARKTADHNTKGIKTLQEAIDRKKALQILLLKHQESGQINEVEDLKKIVEETTKKLEDTKNTNDEKLRIEGERATKNNYIKEIISDVIVKIHEGSTVETSLYLEFTINNEKINTKECKVYVALGARKNPKDIEIAISDGLRYTIASCNITLDSVIAEFNKENITITLDKAKIKMIDSETDKEYLEEAQDKSSAMLIRYGDGVRFLFKRESEIFGIDNEGVEYPYDEDGDVELYYNEIDFGSDIKEHDKKSIRIQLKPKIDSNNKEGIIKELMNIKAI